MPRSAGPSGAAATTAGASSGTGPSGRRATVSAAGATEHAAEGRGDPGAPVRQRGHPGAGGAPRRWPRKARAAATRRLIPCWAGPRSPVSRPARMRSLPSGCQRRPASQRPSPARPVPSSRQNRNRPGSAASAGSAPDRGIQRADQVAADRRPTREPGERAGRDVAGPVVRRRRQQPGARPPVGQRGGRGRRQTPRSCTLPRAVRSRWPSPNPAASPASAVHCARVERSRRAAGSGPRGRHAPGAARGSRGTRRRQPAVAQ